MIICQMVEEIVNSKSSTQPSGTPIFLETDPEESVILLYDS